MAVLLATPGSAATVYPGTEQEKVVVTQGVFDPRAYKASARHRTLADLLSSERPRRPKLGEEEEERMAGLHRQDKVCAGDG